MRRCFGYPTASPISNLGCSSADPSGCSFSRGQAVDLDMVILYVIMPRNTITPPINPPIGDQSISTLAELAPVHRCIKTVSPPTTPLLRRLEHLTFSSEGSLSPPQAPKNPGGLSCGSCHRQSRVCQGSYWNAETTVSGVSVKIRDWCIMGEPESVWVIYSTKSAGKPTSLRIAEIASWLRLSNAFA